MYVQVHKYSVEPITNITLSTAQKRKLIFKLNVTGTMYTTLSMLTISINHHIMRRSMEDNEIYSSFRTYSNLNIFRINIRSRVCKKKKKKISVKC